MLSMESFKQGKTRLNRSCPASYFHHPAAFVPTVADSFGFIQAMHKKENYFRRIDICPRLFNFIMNGLIARGLKRVTLGHPIPQGSTNRGELDGNARNGVQEPLISHAKPDTEERANTKLKDDSDYVVKIKFKQTEELDYWTPVDKLGSSAYVAAKDDKAMEKRNEFTDLSGKKKISLLNGISVGTIRPQVQGKTEVSSQGEGSTGTKVIIPIIDSTREKEKKKKADTKLPSPKQATPIQPDASEQMLSGFGLNINEISEIFIQNTRDRMSRNVSLEEPEES